MSARLQTDIREGLEAHEASGTDRTADELAAFLFGYLEQVRRARSIARSKAHFDRSNYKKAIATRSAELARTDAEVDADLEADGTNSDPYLKRLLARSGSGSDTEENRS